MVSDLKRKCEVCGKTLSVYNTGRVCFAHNPAYPQYEWIPVTKVTSYSKEMWDRDEDMDGLFPIPGTDSFNGSAFRQELIYPKLEED
jgi:hypothetical protein